VDAMLFGRNWIIAPRKRSTVDEVSKMIPDHELLWAVSATLEHESPWNMELHFQAAAWDITKSQPCTDSAGAFAHSEDTPVAFTAGLKILRIYSAAVVAYSGTKRVGRIRNFDLDLSGFSVAEGIGYSFPTDQVDFVAHGRSKPLWCSLVRDSKVCDML
jgi:hypothetical protein